MSTLKNQFQRARSVLNSLVQGTHHKTGVELPEDSIVNEIEVSRAMATAVLALDQMSARLARRAQLPKSVGKPWTDEEEERLRREFNSRVSIPNIAAKHGRTIRAIEARLEKLRLLSPDQRITANPTTAANR